MKILYGITKSNFGGAQRYVFDLAVEAKKRGHEVAVVCGEQGLLVTKLKEENIHVISLPGMKRDISLWREVKTFFALIKILKKERPDVFHVNSSKMGGLGAVAGRLTGVKQIIFTSHGWEFNAPRPDWQKVLIKFFSWLIVLSSHKTICVSKKTRENISSWPFVKKKLIVIYNGIENFQLKERSVARKELSITSNETVIVGTLAELHKVKGLDILLEAWRILKPGLNANLVIAGQGEEERNLKNMAKNLNLGAGSPSGSVKFLGFIPEARSLLSGFDIFVLPSRSENLPYAILEAGFAELPVIASAVGGVPEIITENENGILIAPENSSELSIKIKKLLENKNLAKHLGENLRKTISEKFSKQTMFDKTFSTYQ